MPDVVDALNSVHGLNPQHLVETIIRNRIFECIYWKEHCFGLTAETIVDKAIVLNAVGGVYSGIQKPTEFICLIMVLLQLQPDKAIVRMYLQNEDHKYLTALAALYLRLTFNSVDCYRYLEPLLLDKRKLRLRNRDGSFTLTYMDEFADKLLREDRVCDIILPRITKRFVLVETKELEPRASILLEELEMMEEGEEIDVEKTKKSANGEDKDKQAEEGPNNINGQDKVEEKAKDNKTAGEPKVDPGVREGDKGKGIDVERKETTDIDHRDGRRKDNGRDGGYGDRERESNRRRGRDDMSVSRSRSRSRSRSVSNHRRNRDRDRDGRRHSRRERSMSVDSHDDHSRRRSSHRRDDRDRDRDRRDDRDRDRRRDRRSDHDSQRRDDDRPGGRDDRARRSYLDNEPVPSSRKAETDEERLARIRREETKDDGFNPANLSTTASASASAAAKKWSSKKVSTMFKKPTAKPDETAGEDLKVKSSSLAPAPGAVVVDNWLSVEEQNRIRESVGLKPIRPSDAAPSVAQLGGSGAAAIKALRGDGSRMPPRVRDGPSGDKKGKDSKKKDEAGGKDAAGDSMSIDETNAMRIKLGLKPLK